MEWISVKQLPENNNDVFVTDGESCTCAWYHKYAEIWFLCDDLFDASSYHESCVAFLVGEITHWMKIPELPKENNNE